MVDADTGTKRQLTLTGADGTHTVEVTIPVGVATGQRVRLGGQGGKGMGRPPDGGGASRASPATTSWRR